MFLMAHAAPTLWRRGQRGVDDDLGIGQDATHMIGVAEALRINLVNMLRAGGPCREPAARRDDLHAAERRAVAGCSGEDRLNRLTGQIAGADRLR